MADQDLRVYALDEIADPLKGNPQKRTIRGEEFVAGLARDEGITAQLWNTMMNLVTHYSPPSDICPYPFPNTGTITDVILHMNGQAITEEDQPVLFEQYGGNLPDMSADNLTGMIWVVRNH